MHGSTKDTSVRSKHGDSQPARSEFHPTTPHVAAIFLDILFGVLLGVIILEYPVKAFPGQGLGRLALFNAMYFTLLTKFFLHWWGIHHDVAVFYEFLDYRPELRNYLAGLATAFVYFLCIRLLVVWLESPRHDEWALHALFLLLGAFKILDIAANLISVKQLVEDLLTRFKPPSKEEKMEGALDWYGMVRDWYVKKQRWIVSCFFVSVPFLLSEPFLPDNFRYYIVFIYVLVEVLVERKLFGSRRKIWGDLHPTEAKGPRK